MDLWRVSNYADLRGIGGLQAAGRWHSRGKAIVYLADHPASCILEMLVHLDRDLIPATYRLLRVGVPDKMSIENVGSLPLDWRNQPALTRQIGDDWLSGRSSALLNIPSVIVPHGRNYCLNPNHPDVRDIVVMETTDATFDRRLLGRI